jgi:hypothetical protein
MSIQNLTETNNYELKASSINVSSMTALTLNASSLKADLIEPLGAGNLVLSATVSQKIDIPNGQILRLRNDNTTLDIYGFQHTFDGSSFTNRAILTDDAVNRAFEIGAYTGNNRANPFKCYAQIVALAGSDDGKLEIKHIDVLAGGEYRFNNVKVMDARKTGWAVQTGVATRTDFNPAVLAEVSATLKALVQDLTSHGMIGV